MAEAHIIPLPDSGTLFALVNSVTDGVIAYTQDFRVQIFNARAEELFGVKAVDIIGQQFSLEMAQKPEWHALSSVFYASLAPTVVQLTDAGVYPHIIKVIFDSPSRELLISTNQILDGAGMPCGFVKVVHDTTREASLVKSKSDFITIAAHQLRTPATAINWTFENLVKNTSLDSDTQEAVRMGHTAAQNLLKIINNLLTTAQLEEGRFGYELQPVNMVEFLDRLLADAMPIARQFNVTIYFNRPPEQEVLVFADPGKLGIAVANLLDNAIKYNVSGGEVITTLSRESGAATVSIKDTGAGIPEEDVPKIFEKFFRASNARNSTTEGSGLGLYLTKNIIEAHKGTISLESVVGRGTTFTFTLPLI